MASEKLKQQKASYVGAPAIFFLELACSHLNRAFGGYGCFMCGSSMERADWRDVDVRMILSDEDFKALFPAVENIESPLWEFDSRWLVMTTAISGWLREQTKLPVDFQFQPQTFANAHHSKPRSALGKIINRPAGTAGEEA